jgi:transcriptional regulator with XRE-family HTH domain
MKSREFEKAGAKFGERLRTIRRDKGITQYQLADRSGLSQRMINYYESHVKRPSLDKVKQLAEALGISSDELIGIAPQGKDAKKEEEVSYRIMKRVKVIEELPLRDQRAIFRLINSLAEKNKMRGKL